MRAAVGEQAFDVKPLSERKIETVSTGELIGRIMGPDTQELQEHLFDICFGVFSWGLYKFAGELPKFMSGLYQTRSKGHIRLGFMSW